jgi:4-alpha-glucanotransferase
MSSFPRLAGTLVPVFALRHPHDFGIGDTQAVRDAITFCAQNRLGVLQLLPINETGDDNSPYNAISSVALDPAYLHLVPEEVPGLLPETLAELFPDSVRAEIQRGGVHYRRSKQLKLEILSHAYVEFEAVDLETGTDLAYEFQEFVEKNMGWLPGYTLFRTLLNEYIGNALWHQWAPEHQGLASAEIWMGTVPERDELKRYRQFTAYVQWIAWRQWQSVRAFADQNKVKLMGDIPFGVSRYSADVWSERELFTLDWSGGAPPEPFFVGGEFLRRWGQNWGIPLYNWDAHRAQNFAWWRQRVGAIGRVFHGFRIDHVLGFFRIYSFPWLPQENDEYAPLLPEDAKAKAGGREPQFLPRPDKPEENAELNCRDGEALLRMIQAAAGDTIVIAEDLGVVPKYVPALLQKLGIPGFSIPQFYVDPDTNNYIPRDQLPEIGVATWGTHDHAPLLAWYNDMAQRWKGPDGHAAWLDLQRLMRFLGEDENAPPPSMTPELHEKLLRALLDSSAGWAVFLINDIFNLDLRFNAPGTATDDNWSQRLDRPLTAFHEDPQFAPRLEFLREAITASRRAPG